MLPCVLTEYQFSAVYTRNCDDSVNVATPSRHEWQQILDRIAEVDSTFGRIAVHASSHSLLALQNDWDSIISFVLDARELKRAATARALLQQKLSTGTTRSAFRLSHFSLLCVMSSSRMMYAVVGRHT